LRKRTAKIVEHEHFWYSFISFNWRHGLLDVIILNGLRTSLLDYLRYF